MLARVAESIYWMSRNIERAENLARFIDVTMNVILDQPLGAGEQWEPLVRTTGDFGVSGELPRKAAREIAAQKVAPSFLPKPIDRWARETYPGRGIRGIDTEHRTGR